MELDNKKLQISIYMLLLAFSTQLCCTSMDSMKSNTPSKQSIEWDDVEEEATQDTNLNNNLSVNFNASMITDADILQFYDSQAQIVFELYVEAQNQFSNMRYFNALNLLDRSIAVVPTIQAYLLQVMIYSRIGDNEKAKQVYAKAEILNEAMGEDLLKPIELLTGVSVFNSSN